MSTTDVSVDGYTQFVRLIRRRRPAGDPRVPTEVAEPRLVAWRLGPSFELRDLSGACIATIWRHAGTDRWCRARWPHEATGAPVAPRDLSVAHILEVARAHGASAQYACVVAVQFDVVVAYLAWDYNDAEQASRYLIERFQGNPDDSSARAVS